MKIWSIKGGIVRRLLLLQIFKTFQKRSKWRTYARNITPDFCRTDHLGKYCLSHPTMLLKIFSFNLLHIAHSLQRAEYSLLRGATKYEVCDYSSLLFGLISLFFIYLMGKYRLISVNAHTRLSVILREYSLKTLVPLVFVFINVLEEDSMNFSTTDSKRKRHSNLTLYNIIWRGYIIYLALP